MDANALGFLRFVLAMLVVWVHYEQLTGTLVVFDVTDLGLSHLAVNCFFVLSGFLMPRSFGHAPSVFQFYQKRFLRIYVSYFIVVTVVAVAAIGVSSCGIVQYFSVEWLKYYSLNLLTLNFLKPDLSCLFQDHIFTAVNGSLWSIKVELMFYLCVPLIFWFLNRAAEKKIWYLLVFMALAMCINVGFSAVALYKDSAFWKSMLNQLPAKLCFFVAGWFLFELSKIRSSALTYGLAVGLVLGLLAFVFASHNYELVHLPICVSLVYMFFNIRVASHRSQVVLKLLGGVSYALYLIHYPLAQVLIALIKDHVLPSKLLLPCFVMSLLMLSIILYVIESKILEYCKRQFKMD